MGIILFPDIEAAVMTQLESDLVDYDRECPVSQSVPIARPSEFVTVQRTGGPKRDLVTDSASLTFECWSDSGGGAATLANLVRAIVHSWQGQRIGGAIVYQVQEFAGPGWLPDPVSKQARYTFTASIDVRGNSTEPGGTS